VSPDKRHQNQPYGSSLETSLEHRLLAWFLVCLPACLPCLFVLFVCFVCLFVCFVCLFVLFVCFVCLSVCLSVGRSVGRSVVRLSFVCRLFVCLPVCLPACLPGCLSFFVCVRLSLSVSIIPNDRKSFMSTKGTAAMPRLSLRQRAQWLERWAIRSCHGTWNGGEHQAQHPARIKCLFIFVNGSRLEDWSILVLNDPLAVYSPKYWLMS